jgi:acyl-CoA-binding protein
MATTAQANPAAAAAADTRDLGDMDDLDELFHAAADHLGQLVTAAPAAVPDSRKLQLYGLYKQATVGACDTAKPAFWDRTGCSKW